MKRIRGEDARDEVEKFVRSMDNLGDTAKSGNQENTAGVEVCKTYLMYISILMLQCFCRFIDIFILFGRSSFELFFVGSI